MITHNGHQSIISIDDQYGMEIALNTTDTKHIGTQVVGSIGCNPNPYNYSVFFSLYADFKHGEKCNAFMWRQSYID